MFVQFNSPLSWVRIIYCNKTNVREIRQYGWIIGLLSKFFFLLFSFNVQESTKRKYFYRSLLVYLLPLSVFSHYAQIF